MPEVLVPPRRLGVLLRQSRVAAGVDMAELASRSAELTVGDLDDIEHGRRAIDDRLVRLLLDVYGIDDTELVPQRSRLVIDLDEGHMAIATETTVVDTSDPELVLVRYLALVHRLRGVPVESALEVRELDIGVLAAALELPGTEIEADLTRLQADGTAVARSDADLRRRLLLPIAGVVVATTAVGVLLLVGDDPTPIGEQRAERVMVRVDESGTDGETTTDIADAVVLEAGGEQTTRDG